MFRGVQRVALPLVIRRAQSSGPTASFWRWTTTPGRPHWLKDFKEGAVAFVVFGVTGSASVALIRPAIERGLGIRGSLIEGPNSYRAACLLIFSPLYALTLGVLGTLAGRHIFFAGMAKKILTRLLPFQAVRSRLTCPFASNRP